MKILPDIGLQELKRLATTPGQNRYLAFAELACRTRDDPSIWDQQGETRFWGPLDCTRAPNRRHRKVCTQNYVKHPPVGIYTRIFVG